MTVEGEKRLLVKQAGEVRVGESDLVLDEDYARVWEVTLDSKYAQLLSFSADEVLLIAGERTLNVDEARRGVATVLAVDLPAGWAIMVDCSRYTCRVAGFRVHHDGDLRRRADGQLQEWGEGQWHDVADPPTMLS